uniref:Uncharacterized protein n=1 Tax=Molossus molossus TaxID=27622 RepID=A0A7J8F9M4_MOLMO|nr:hypothetical protein HJG59_008607 [Molossus molossus]
MNWPRSQHSPRGIWSTQGLDFNILCWGDRRQSESARSGLYKVGSSQHGLRKFCPVFGKGGVKSPSVRTPNHKFTLIWGWGLNLFYSCGLKSHKRKTGPPLVVAPERRTHQSSLKKHLETQASKNPIENKF